MKHEIELLQRVLETAAKLRRRRTGVEYSRSKESGEELLAGSLGLLDTLFTSIAGCFLTCCIRINELRKDQSRSEIIRRRQTVSQEKKERGLTQLVRFEGLGVRVETVEGRLVDERVLPLRATTGVEDNILGRTNDGLDLIRVDDAGHVRVRDLGRREAERRDRSIVSPITTNMNKIGQRALTSSRA